MPSSKGQGAAGNKTDTQVGILTVCKLKCPAGEYFLARGIKKSLNDVVQCFGNHPLSIF